MNEYDKTLMWVAIMIVAIAALPLAIGVVGAALEALGVVDL